MSRKSTKTPEELRKQRLESLKKARDAAAANRRKKVETPARTATSVPVAAPHEFIGITRTDCCVDCTAERCVISGKPVCAHPCKGGLQPIHMLDQAASARYDRARKHLAHVELDKRP